MAEQIYDLVIIGGGINGAGIAADAAGRGLSVLLAEADDLAGATSSASSKLIHGGLRYLEHYAFRLVREALAEREVLLAKAPHIVRPLRFILPEVPGMRPAPLLRAGLFLYDHLSSRRTLGASERLDLVFDAAGKPLAAGLTRGFAYWDCWVDDARLVVLNAIAARQNGAEVLTRTPVSALGSSDGKWRVTLNSGAAARTVTARAVVNAAGPWVEAVARMVAAPAQPRAAPQLRLVKGCHIVVPRIAAANDAYIFQNSDKRVVFALPFEEQFTLLGTTDTPFTGDPRAAAVTDDDRAYLLDVADRFFKAKLSAADIRWQFAGVRPLDDDGSADPSKISRDYRLDLDTSSGAPILHIIGGKITTYRRLAEAALSLLAPHVRYLRPAWTAHAPLPGGDFGAIGYENWLRLFAARHAGFDAAFLQKLVRRYGTRAGNVIGEAQTVDGLGPDLGGGLREREVAYLKREEWARTADDVLWRRTKAGLSVPADERARFAQRVTAALEAGA